MTDSMFDQRPIVLACDGAYAPQLATCLRSIVEADRGNWPLGFHILTEGFSVETRARVHGSLPPGSASINWIPVDVSDFQNCWTMEHVSKMTFARLLIPSVFPETVSKVIYLDADILVLDSLSPLWDADLEGHPIGAVLDDVDRHIKVDTPGFEGVPRVRAYFSAGILIIDLHRWREERIAEKARNYALGNPSSPYYDQDALNVVCDGRWKPLDARWNYQGHIDNRIEDLPSGQAPGIVHFVTMLKPWKPSSLNPNASLYDRFRRRTLFARTLREIVLDSLEVSWCRCRGFLGRQWPLRSLRNYLATIRSRNKRSKGGCLSPEAARQIGPSGR